MIKLKADGRFQFLGPFQYISLYTQFLSANYVYFERKIFIRPNFLSYFAIVSNNDYIHFIHFLCNTLMFFNALRD